MISSVRMRLTLWYVGVLAAVLAVFSIGAFGLIAQSLYARVEGELRTVQQVAAISLQKDAEEGDPIQFSVDTTVREIANPPQRIAIYDGSGRLLANNSPYGFPPLAPPAKLAAPGEVTVYEIPEWPGSGELQLVSAQAIRTTPENREYVVLVSQPLEPISDELGTIRRVFFTVIPAALALAGIGGWFLVRRSLAPAVAMTEEARRISAEDLARRLPVVQPRDELGRLATNINELLGRLHESFTLQRQFMADASHELRTPLSVVGTAVDVTLEQPQRTEEEYRDALTLVGEQSRRLARTVEDMFILARADSGRYPLRRAVFYLEELLDEATRAARILGASRGIEVTSGSFGEAPFTGDEDLLRQMFLNLLDNALKHTPAGGKVHAELAKENGHYAVAISDTGSGIPVEAQPHIFERFYRVDRARSRAASGTGSGAGLGLPIALWIAEAHGGRLEIAQSDERGTTIRVTLPMRPPDSAGGR